MRAMLAITDLSYARGQEPALAPVSFELAGGQLLFVIGGNGSGKTTLMRLLAGLLPPPPEARATWHDQAWQAGRDEHGPLTRYVGHRLAVKDELSCQENLTFYARLLAHSSPIALHSALASVGLDGYQPILARQLSAGQRKRLALARLLVCPADLWLLDEPYSNLDHNGTVLVDRLLTRHLTEGGLAVVTSHGGYRPSLEGLCELKLEAA